MTGVFGKTFCPASHGFPEFKIYILHSTFYKATQHPQQNLYCIACWLHVESVDISGAFHDHWRFECLDIQICATGGAELLLQSNNIQSNPYWLNLWIWLWLGPLLLTSAHSSWFLKHDNSRTAALSTLYFKFKSASLITSCCQHCNQNVPSRSQWLWHFSWLSRVIIRNFLPSSNPVLSGTTLTWIACYTG